MMWDWSAVGFGVTATVIAWTGGWLGDRWRARHGKEPLAGNDWAARHFVLALTAPITLAVLLCAGIQSGARALRRRLKAPPCPPELPAAGPYRTAEAPKLPPLPVEIRMARAEAERLHQLARVRPRSCSRRPNGKR